MLMLEVTVLQSRELLINPLLFIEGHTVHKNYMQLDAIVQVTLLTLLKKHCYLPVHVWLTKNGSGPGSSSLCISYHLHLIHHCHII